MNPQAVADVFLSYSRADSDAIQQVQRGLRDAGLTTFLDRDQLPAGQPWMPALEAGLSHCGAVAVFVGPAGLGTWQRREIQLALDRQAEVERANQAFPVIPVLLPKVTDPPGGFLRLQTWVDLRADLADPEQLHLLLAGIRGEAPTGAAIREAICPYRGLLTFREEDAGLFFGREDEVKEFVAKVRDQSLLTLVGRSGSGKSSVIYAGLIPALRRRADGRSWAVVSFRPGTEPLHALVRAFYTPPPDFTPFEVDQKIKDQVAILRSDVEALGDRIRGFLATPEEQGTDRLLLYVDQWEELYTQALRHPILDGAQAEADIARFVDLLLHAVRTSPCTVVLTVRADFYGDLLRHDALAAAVPPGLVNLGPMSRADLARAIRQPGNAVGLAVDGPLVEAMLDAVAEDLAKLPLLEYALKETWQRRREHRLTLDAYGEAGGIDGAVAKRANEIFAGLGAVGQAAARRLFVSLVTPGEGHEDTRARVAVPDDPALGAVIHAFSGADARLLVTGEDVVLSADTPVARRLVEISHEALIREWEPLREWIEANRDTLRRRERVRDWMAAWDEQEKRDPSLLLPPGLALEVGRKLLEEHGDVLIDDVRPYVEASIAAENERRRQEEAKAEAERQRELVAARRLAVEQRKRTKLAIGLGLFGLLLAVLAGWQWLQARDQARIAVAERDRAEHNLQIAAQAADGLVFDLAQGLRNVSGVSTDMIRQILSRADKLLSELAGGEDAPANLLRTRWAAQLEFGTTYMAQGDLGAALAANEEAYELIAKLAASDPGNAQWQRDLSVSWDRLGDVRVAQGDLTGALEAYTEGKAIREKLAASDPGNAQWQRDLSVSWDKLGDVRVAQGDLTGALAGLHRKQGDRREAGGLRPGQRGVAARPVGELGEAGRRAGGAGRPPRRAQAYTDGKAIAEKLAAADPGNAQWQRDLSVSWDKLGDVRLAQGDLAGALAGLHRGPGDRREAGGRRPGQRRVAARPVGELGQAGRRAGGAGLPPRRAPRPTTRGQDDRRGSWRPPTRATRSGSATCR